MTGICVGSPDCLGDALASLTVTGQVPTDWLAFAPLAGQLGRTINPFTFPGSGVGGMPAPGAPTPPGFNPFAPKLPPLPLPTPILSPFAEALIAGTIATLFPTKLGDVLPPFFAPTLPDILPPLPPLIYPEVPQAPAETFVYGTPILPDFIPTDPSVVPTGIPPLPPGWSPFRVFAPITIPRTAAPPRTAPGRTPVPQPTAPPRVAPTPRPTPTPFASPAPTPAPAPAPAPAPVLAPPPFVAPSVGYQGPLVGGSPLTGLGSVPVPFTSPKPLRASGVPAAQATATAASIPSCFCPQNNKQDAERKKKYGCRQGYFRESALGITYKTWSTRKCPSSKTSSASALASQLQTS